MQAKFRESDIPYNSLEKVGITKMQVLSLDKSNLEALLSGKRTSIFQMHGTDSKGDNFDLRGKISLYRKEDGTTGVNIHPVRNNILNDINLSKDELQKIEAGELITKKINGERHLVQLDPETKELLKAKTKDIVIPSHIKDVELNRQQKEKLRLGQSITIDSGRERLQVGIDLNNPRGLKLTDAAFEQKQKEAYDRNNPQIMGTIQTDQNRAEFMDYHKKSSNHIKV